MLTVDAECSQSTPVAERPPPPIAVNDERHCTFEQVVERQQAHVTKLARRLLGWSSEKDEIDDVVQDVFLAVLKGLPSFRGQSSVSTWITRITINGCRAHRRKRRLRRALYDRWMRQAPTAQEPEPDHPADEREATNRRVREAVAGLSDRYREVVVLRYLQGMDVDEMAAVLGLTRGAIEVRLHRARRMLKGELGPLMEER